jgi:hypothetical protein
MAEVLDGHDFRSGHGNSKYPWQDWEDGKTRRIVRGEDFEVEAKVMQGQIKVRGSKAGRRTATNVQGDAVVFTFQRDGESEEGFRARTRPSHGG